MNNGETGFSRASPASGNDVLWSADFLSWGLGLWIFEVAPLPQGRVRVCSRTVYGRRALGENPVAAHQAVQRIRGFGVLQFLLTPPVMLGTALQTAVVLLLQIS